MSDVIEVNSGNLVYKLFIPSKYLSVDASEDEKEVADHYLSLLKQIASGERNAIVFPSDRDEQGNLYFDLRVVGAHGTEEAVPQNGQSTEEQEVGGCIEVIDISKVSIRTDSVRAAAKFILANNKYKPYGSVAECEAAIYRAIKEVIKKDWQMTGTAGWEVHLSNDGDGYRSIDVLVDPTLSSEGDFISLDEFFEREGISGE